MQHAGYSQRPLAAKLGLAPGMRALLLDAPPGYLAALGEVAAQVEFRDPSALDTTDAASVTNLDFIQLFALEQAALAERLPSLAAALASHGALWLCWPKRAAKLPTDVTEAGVRAAGLAVGLVDVKVAAIDATWSGLKFVRRLRDRA